MMRFLEKTDGSPLQGLLHKLKYAAASDPDVLLYCAACLRNITSNRERIEVQGASEHVYANPHGFRFHIVCFREADGCLNHGEPVALHTWFAGYDWCYALCRGCRTHLGWYYTNGDRGFYGLIKDRLVENSAPPANH